ncbi:hypothetical protein LJC61_02505 [Ruminococcaceae bacterium OttesenSCG-928-A16]|nr:hypothetical protein [Ruminococcaceae bacterium OttesenSCG-928-A16]
MFQIVFVTVISAVVAIGFIFFSTTSDGAEESSTLEMESACMGDASHKDAA